jgi:hypothetical protein
MTSQHRHTLAIAVATSLAIAVATSLAFAGCKKDPPASPPARSGDTAAAPEPSATPPKPRAAPPTVAQPTPAVPETPPPPPPSRDVAADDSTDEGAAGSAAAAEGTVEARSERRLAAMQRRAVQIHEQFDTNHDGVLSPEELANAHGRRAHFDDPFALDTDHDGDISPDELAAGLKERAEARRAQLLGSDGAPQQP